MMLPIISIEIDGKIVASFDIGGYTTISGKTLYIYLRSYEAIARNPEIIELSAYAFVNQIRSRALTCQSFLRTTRHREAAFDAVRLLIKKERNQKF